MTAIAGALSWYAHKDDARALGRVEAWEVEESVSVERGTVAAARAAAWARAEERSELERGGAVLVIAQGAGPGGAGPLLLSVRGAAEPGAGQLPDGAARPHAAAARQWADAIGVWPGCRAPAGSAAHIPAAGRAARATRAREALTPPDAAPPPRQRAARSRRGAALRLLRGAGAVRRGLSVWREPTPRKAAEAV